MRTGHSDGVTAPARHTHGAPPAQPLVRQHRRQQQALNVCAHAQLSVCVIAGH
jgi:hypothetical protein